MQTPRGFLIGAGVIVAIAAITSIGHPQSEILVETTAPVVTDRVDQTTTTTSATTSGPQIQVLPKSVDAGDTEAPGSTTTVELRGAALAPAEVLSTPAAESRGEVSPTTTVVQSVGNEATEEATTTVAPTTVGPTTSTPPTTLPPTTTTTVPTVTTTQLGARVTLPSADTSVPRVTLPPVPVPATPVVPTPPK